MRWHMINVLIGSHPRFVCEDHFAARGESANLLIKSGSAPQRPFKITNGFSPLSKCRQTCWASGVAGWVGRHCPNNRSLAHLCHQIPFSHPLPLSEIRAIDPLL